MKIFISQPMRNFSNEEIISKRNEISNKLIKEGHFVINSFEPQNLSQKNIPVFLLGKSIEKMSESEGVYFMDGWESARGCIIEHDICEKYNIKIIHD